ncbi:hypothetical protein [Streptomyces sp. NPDC048111]|uniref:hypothetical protein n=1 Tax=Streptomyces sp. NPDC048111 TaxID=3365500 RepID=UPI00371AB743
MGVIVFAMALGLLTACGPYQYYRGTGFHGAKAGEVVGAWENVEGTRVMFRPDGTASIEKLDGQDFDFDRGWRLSGTGTWKLTDSESGQLVLLRLTGRTEVASRSSTTPVDVPAPPPPSAYTWSFFVDHDRHDALVLFFFFGDPDAGSMYLMSRRAAP